MPAIQWWLVYATTDALFCARALAGAILFGSLSSKAVLLVLLPVTILFMASSGKRTKCLKTQHQRIHASQRFRDFLWAPDTDCGVDCIWYWGKKEISFIYYLKMTFVSSHGIQQSARYLNITRPLVTAKFSAKVASVAMSDFVHPYGLPNAENALLQSAGPSDQELHLHWKVELRGWRPTAGLSHHEKAHRPYVLSLFEYLLDNLSEEFKRNLFWKRDE